MRKNKRMTEPDRGREKGRKERERESVCDRKRKKDRGAVEE